MAPVGVATGRGEPCGHRLLGLPLFPPTVADPNGSVALMGRLERLTLWGWGGCWDIVTTCTRADRQV